LVTKTASDANRPTVLDKGGLFQNVLYSQVNHVKDRDVYGRTDIFIIEVGSIAGNNQKVGAKSG